MRLEKILILGSTYLTQLVANRLAQELYEVIGYVPSKKPTFQGDLWWLPIVDSNVDCDIMLSIQYDRKIISDIPGFNLHTGLLPEYGGLDILRHTINEGAREQGLTFHKMVNDFDAGPIISKITYPVFPQDTIMDLYKKQCLIAPDFVLSCLKLLETMTTDEVNNCVAKTPRLLKRTGEKLTKHDTPF